VCASRQQETSCMKLLKKLPLWVWLEYTVVPRWIQLNLLAMAHHAGEAFELHLLNRSTLGNHLTLPPEFERIPYAVAASDVARIGLLAVHGGLYMDADFLVMRSLAPLRSLLEQHEIVSYTDSNCSYTFSTNFVAARPGLGLWVETWETLQKQLRRTCGPGIKVCCFEGSRGSRVPVPCRVPWAITDKMALPIFKSYVARGQRPRMHCFEGDTGLTPHADGLKCARKYSIHTLSIAGAKRTHPTISPSHWTRDHKCHNSSIVCMPANDGHIDLACSVRARGGRALKTVSRNFYGRLAHHLFESISGEVYSAYEKIEESDLVVATLYQKALNGMPQHMLPRPSAMLHAVRVRSDSSTAAETHARMQRSRSHSYK
jgi:hypothetical protein